MNFFSQEMNKFIRHTFVPFTMEIIVFLNVNKNVKNDCYSAELIFFAVKKNNYSRWNCFYCSCDVSVLMSLKFEL